MYCCPICGSGTGKDKSGALKIYAKSKRIICFNAAKCFGEKGQDNVGALQLLWGISERELFSRLGYEVTYSKSKSAALPNGVKIYTVGAQNQKQDENELPDSLTTADEPVEDYTAYFVQCRERLCDTGYAKQRGLSE